MEIEVFSHAELEQSGVYFAVGFRYSHSCAELLDGFRGISPLAHTAQRRHTRIVPTGDETGIDELLEIALRHYRVLDIETGELYLSRGHGEFALLAHPVVQRAVVFEFESAYRMGDSVERVAYRMSEIVHGINAPLVAGAVMVRAQNSVNYRIAHVDIGARHIYLGAQYLTSVGIFALFHLLEKSEIFLYTAVTVRAFFAGLGKRAASGADLVRGIVAHVSNAFFD